MKNNKFLCVFVCLVGILYPANLCSKIKQYVAKAYDQTTGAYLFKAKYREYWKNNKHISTIIKYQKQKHRGIFSIKKMNFTKNLIAPNMTYKEIKTGYQYGATRTKKKSIDLFLQLDSKTSPKSNTILLAPNSVVDEGSNYFIKRNWTKLLKGEVAHFKFISPPEQTYYSFTVRKEKETKKSVTFILGASGLIIKLMAQPMRVTYNKKRKRIISYNGLTNVRENEKGISANVLFSY